MFSLLLANLSKVFLTVFPPLFTVTSEYSFSIIVARSIKSLSLYSLLVTPASSLFGMLSYNLFAIDSIIPPASWPNLEFCKFVSPPFNNSPTSFLFADLSSFIISPSILFSALKSVNIPCKLLCVDFLVPLVVFKPGLAFILLFAVLDISPLLKESIKLAT